MTPELRAVRSWHPARPADPVTGAVRPWRLVTAALAGGLLLAAAACSAGATGDGGPGGDRDARVGDGPTGIELPFGPSPEDGGPDAKPAAPDAATADAAHDGGPTPAPDAAACERDEDCPPLSHPCRRMVCAEGRCATWQREDGTPCDDADPCSSGDACQAGRCVGDEDVCGCRDDGDCASAGADLCGGVPFCDRASVPYTCRPDPVTVVTCDDAFDTDCRTMTCRPETGACELVPAPDGTPCSDDNPCSSGDACQGGRCVSGWSACECESDADCVIFDDGDPCNGVIRCDTAANPPGCAVDPASVVTCDDPTAGDCTGSVCDPYTGACAARALVDGAWCDDGDPCTAFDQCRAGVCTGSRTCGSVCDGRADGAWCDGDFLITCRSGAMTSRTPCPNGCESMPDGTPDRCSPGTPTCPSGNGAYCGAALGLDPDTLYSCVDGRTTVLEVCSEGCEPQPPGTPDRCRGATPVPCPAGNGAYCGAALGLDAGTLYSCVNGSSTVLEVCANGCETMPAGTPDRCAGSTTTPCPSGDGAYCGATLGLDPGTLYDCRAGQATAREVCPDGCRTMPPGTPDECAAPSGSCPSGNGAYCGASLGLDADTLYSCANGTTTVLQRCDDGCQTMPPGTPDRCAGAPSTAGLHLCNPFDPPRAVTCAYGCYTNHYGTDYAVPNGTPVYAPAGGVVVQVTDTVPGQTCTLSFGNNVRIQQGRYLIILAHLSADIRVDVNDPVEAGDLIGFASNTGYTLTLVNGAWTCNAGGGYHLHLEVRRDGTAFDPYDAADVVWGDCDGGSGPVTYCPSGNGAYCGATLGLDPNTLYDCVNGSTSVLQVCANGCETMPAGTADRCRSGGGTCPAGDGAYCGSSLGLDANTLYQCTGGATSVLQACPNGCEVMPAGTPDRCRSGGGTCPSGNGAYCGSSLGLAADTLYSCTDGATSVLQVCANGCEVMPAGTPDRCRTGGGSCPSGNGRYCGTTLGLDGDTLYLCTDGQTSVVETCDHGCEVMPPGTDDRCAAAPASCPSGNGRYCGGTLGLDSNTLYRCVDGVTSVIERCEDGCEVMPPGTDDRCAEPSSGGCPSGDGLYCGETLGRDSDTLYNCSDGDVSFSAYCLAGCHVAPPGSPDACNGGSCPAGNGAYCGGTFGLDGDTLYNCSNGRVTVLQRCSGGCVVAPPGQADYCR